MQLVTYQIKFTQISGANNFRLNIEFSFTFDSVDKK